MPDTERILTRLLDVAKAAQYCGWDKHDGLLSPLLRATCSWSRLTRLAAIQLVTRSPWNLRPMLGIPLTRNPKGAGLFARANLLAAPFLGDPSRATEAASLLTWLTEHTSAGHPGASWGYQYPWQDAGFLAPAHSANRVVTCWIGFAFHAAWSATHDPRYLDVCVKTCEFLRTAPNRTVDTPEELCLSYVPDARVTWAVMDVSALCGKMFALTGTAVKDTSVIADARRCMTYVARRQTHYGGWFYTDPPKASHITHDNYHTGIILDCFADYASATGDTQFCGAYSHGLHFYDSALFLKDGAPKWMNDRIFPHDIHGAAQGIITFSRAASQDRLWLERAEEILRWTIENLYDPEDGVFWWRKNARRVKRIPLMRWCNAWMAVALAEYLAAKGQSSTRRP